jgi:hypothetical protein
LDTEDAAAADLPPTPTRAELNAKIATLENRRERYHGF